MTQRVKILLLIGLLLIGGTQFYFGSLEPDDPEFNAPLSPGGPSHPVNSSKVESTSIAFSLPATKEQVSLAKPRNIFAPLGSDQSGKKKVVVAHKPPPPPPPPPPRPQPSVAQPPPPSAVPPPGPNIEDRARLKAEKEMARYTFLGYLKRSGEQHVFLSNGQALYIVKQGEVVEGGITLKTIEESAVVLSKVLTGMATTAETTLQLTKEGNGT